MTQKTPYEAAAERLHRERIRDAAFDLLDACRVILHHLPISWHTDPANAIVRGQVCDAIAKAEGK